MKPKSSALKYGLIFYLTLINRILLDVILCNFGGEIIVDAQLLLGSLSPGMLALVTQPHVMRKAK